MKNKGNSLELVQQYLMKQNRPYNAATIFLNLHKEVGKTELTKILDQLTEQGVLSSKDYKKFRYYWANQETIHVSEEKLEEIKKTLSEAEEERKKVLVECSQCEKIVSALKETPTDSEMRSRIPQLEKENRVLKEKLQEIKKSSSSVTKKDSDKIDQILKVQVNQWRKRKSMATDIITQICEGNGKKETEMYDEMGVEPDEEGSLDEAVAFLCPPQKRRK